MSKYIQYVHRIIYPCILASNILSLPPRPMPPPPPAWGGVGWIGIFETRHMEIIYVFVYTWIVEELLIIIFIRYPSPL
jgi:hypothetical protein